MGCTDLWKNFRYSCYATPATDQSSTDYLSRIGRFPKNHQNFHPNPDHACTPNLCDANTNAICWQGFGPDACYFDGALGQSSNAIYNPTQSTYSPYGNGGTGSGNGYMRKHTREWLVWCKKQMGFDGVRIDAVKHFPSFASEDFLYNLQQGAGWANGMSGKELREHSMAVLGTLRIIAARLWGHQIRNLGGLLQNGLNIQLDANRVVDAFPPAQQAQVRTQLGDALQGIITQTLLPKASGHGRVIGTEVLVNTPAIANLIREGEVSQIYSMMQAGGELGMHTLDQDLKRLVQKGEISLELAQSRAYDPKSIAEGMNVRSGLVEDTWMGGMGMQQSNGGWNN